MIFEEGEKKKDKHKEVENCFLKAQAEEEKKTAGLHAENSICK